MLISAKSNYAMRALLALAARAPEPVSAVSLAEAGLPLSFVRNILGELRRAELVCRCQTQSDNGWVLARPADSITVGHVLRVVEGPVAEVHGLAASMQDSDGHLRDMWQTLAVQVGRLLDDVTLEDVLQGNVRTGPCADQPLPRRARPREDGECEQQLARSGR